MICFNLSNTLEKQQIEAFESRSRGHWDVSVLSPEASPFSSWHQDNYDWVWICDVST